MTSGNRGSEIVNRILIGLSGMCVLAVAFFILPMLVAQPPGNPPGNPPGGPEFGGPGGPGFGGPGGPGFGGPGFGGPGFGGQVAEAFHLQFPR